MSKKGNELQKVFQLIEEGKNKELNGDHWAAVDCFAHAQTLLTKLSTIAKTEPGHSDDERTKIATLYQRQSREYLHRARKCFLHALQSENEQDETYRETGNDEDPLDAHPPIFVSITQEEAEKRIQHFTVLFSKEIECVTTPQTDESEVDTNEKQSSLEDRLMELNKSIPHGFKTSAERIVEINQGLRRLGLTLYTDESRSEGSLRPMLSDQEQVADIIAQAKDEVKFNLNGEDTPARKENYDDDDDESGSSNDDDEEDDDELESDDNDILLHRKKIRKQVIEAQIELANLVALLDKEPVPLDKAKAVNEVDLERGRKALSDAKRYLGKALKLWDET